MVNLTKIHHILLKRNGFLWSVFILKVHKTPFIEPAAPHTSTTKSRTLRMLLFPFRVPQA